MTAQIIIIISLILVISILTISLIISTWNTSNALHSVDNAKREYDRVVTRKIEIESIMQKQEIRQFTDRCLYDNLKDEHKQLQEKYDALKLGINSTYGKPTRKKKS